MGGFSRGVNRSVVVLGPSRWMTYVQVEVGERKPIADASSGRLVRERRRCQAFYAPALPSSAGRVPRVRL